MRDITGNSFLNHLIYFYRLGSENQSQTKNISGILNIEVNSDNLIFLDEIKWDYIKDHPKDSKELCYKLSPISFSNIMAFLADSSTFFGRP